jgi:hypothetical protein
MGVYRAFKAKKYNPMEFADWAEYFAGRRVRFGAYGDPAAVPFEVWQRIAMVCDHHTGYTHQWAMCDERLKMFVMASVDTPAEYECAQAAGWRTFRVRMEDEELNPTERVCPASEEAGKRVTCLDCMACHGGGSQKAGIAITIHGGTWKPTRFVQIRTLQKKHEPYRQILTEAVRKRKSKDKYYRDGFHVEVIRDRRGNITRYKNTKVKKLAGCI